MRPLKAASLAGAGPQVTSARPHQLGATASLQSSSRASDGCYPCGERDHQPQSGLRRWLMQSPSNLKDAGIPAADVGPLTAAILAGCGTTNHGQLRGALAPSSLRGGFIPVVVAGPLTAAILAGCGTTNHGKLRGALAPSSLRCGFYCSRQLLGGRGDA